MNIKSIKIYLIPISILFAVLCTFIFKTTVYADMGPKPSITIHVNNAPEGQEYYIGLLHYWEGNIETEHYVYDDSLNDKENKACQIITEYYKSDWSLFRSPRGDAAYYHSYETNTYIFDYMVPDHFKVILVTLDGNVYLSDDITKRKFNADFDYDVLTGSIKENVFAGTGIYLVLVLFSFIFTIVIEGLVLLLFKLFNKQNIKYFFIINIITQIILNGILIYTLYYGIGLMLLFIFPITELLIIIIESNYYKKRLVNREGEVSSKRNILYGIVANIASVVGGYFLSSLIISIVVFFIT